MLHVSSFIWDQVLLKTHRILVKQLVDHRTTVCVFRINPFSSYSTYNGPGTFSVCSYLLSFWNPVMGAKCQNDSVVINVHGREGQTMQYYVNVCAKRSHDVSGWRGIYTHENARSGSSSRSTEVSEQVDVGVLLLRCRLLAIGGRRSDIRRLQSPQASISPNF